MSFLMPNQRTSASDRSQSVAGGFSFGPFHLLPGQHLLLEQETPVQIGGRALLLLTALVENAGVMVSKSELMARVWPTAKVEESNLKVHIAALRRVLGDDQHDRRYLATIKGRGYTFVAPVSYCEPTVCAALRDGPGQCACNLPSSITPMIGRADAIASLREALSRHRLVSVVGPGGIGKTTVALHIAETLVGSFAHGVRFVDLAAPTGLDVCAAAAAALGLAVCSGDNLFALTTYLRDRHMLIVLDSCEHVIDDAALLAEQVMRGAPNVVVLAASRQPLRATGEHLHRLPPLRSPPESASLTVAQALKFPAVQLFVDRATEAHRGFELRDEDAPIVADICRNLDGIALAIELVAARFESFGLRGLSELMNDGHRLLNQSRRTVLERHRTLGAALDWSYQLLTQVEGTILQRLSVLSGPFTLEVAVDLAKDSEMTANDVIGGVGQLVEKSLLCADVSDTTTRYRLLRITRAYALQKLAESGEAETIMRRHAGQLHYACN
ncbi:helix-turn-helix transcriptional regulator [Paraburkholderia sp. LEh10]|uniref:ATP-binding protein n=1 Tax=Paraburkholderia sp. LEh10 TaxID=2821353 RepID=UPI001AE8725F|nr:winged helix-turn-helix domain-containing protein [Paraburkholderia sp. LEh10]MBP0589498.1 helix-turn-helix transcriptional regulator [Paraburkholderia sp. LEh10]